MLKRTPQISIAGLSILPRSGKRFREAGAGVVTPLNFPLVPQLRTIFLRRYFIDDLTTPNRKMIPANIFLGGVHEITSRQTLRRH